MYESDLIIKEMQADKLMALMLDKALAGVKDQILESAARMQDGATRLSYYASCFTDNYQDVCTKLKYEDKRFAEGLYQLIRDRRIVYDLMSEYFSQLFRHKTYEQLDFIKGQLLQLGTNISASSFTAESFTLGITSSVCLSLGFSPPVIGKVRALSSGAVGAAGLYGYVQQAAESADRLKRQSPLYYHALCLRKLDMMYFIVEPVFIKAHAFGHQHLSDSQIANIISNMMK
ncbi:hypothetical protein [Trabulsiella odontotermitis]|uniref:hypothetical protein n=1 Tax=Trabulsiella odontotermitis TaxID=379893 RepID=UPI000676580C|nr:hypothetical protein [Trabulsiella odontotermitis]KNC90312.1 hypothetical protein GM30_04195 [Trabulsiella odontotermitis]